MVKGGRVGEGCHHPLVEEKTRAEKEAGISGVAPSVEMLVLF